MSVAVRNRASRTITCVEHERVSNCEDKREGGERASEGRQRKAPHDCYALSDHESWTLLHPYWVHLPRMTTRQCGTYLTKWKPRRRTNASAEITNMPATLHACSACPAAASTSPTRSVDVVEEKQASTRKNRRQKCIAASAGATWSFSFPTVFVSFLTPSGNLRLGGGRLASRLCEHGTSAEIPFPGRGNRVSTAFPCRGPAALV